MTLLPSTNAIVTAGPVSATVTLWVAIADELPLASVTWADTVAVPLASASASGEGMVALELLAAALMVGGLLLVTPLVTVTWKVLLAAMPVTVPVMLTPAPASLRSTIFPYATLFRSVTAGQVSATVTLWVAIADELPLASVTWADTVAVPLASASASVEGIVALQPVAAAFTVAVDRKSVV